MEKEGVLTVLAAAVLTYFSPINGLLLLTTIACIADHCFGVWRVVSLKEVFSFWKGILKTTSKIVVYSALITLAYTFDKFLANEFMVKLLSINLVFAKLITLGLCLNEWRSINKSFKAVKSVSLWDRLTEGAKSARKLLEDAGDAKKMLTVALVFTVASCSPVFRHNHLVKKYPYLHTMDTTEQTKYVPVYIEGVQADTVFRDLLRMDTVTMVKDRITVKYFRDGDTVYLKGSCDPETIIKKIRVKTPIVYYPEPLKWWQYQIAIFSFSLVSLGVGWFLSKHNSKSNA